VPVASALRRYLLAHKLATGRDGEELLFGRTTGAPFTPTFVRKQTREAWATAKPEPLGLHEARHTYVSLMHAAGCSLEEIGDFVGHSGLLIPTGSSSGRSSLLRAAATSSSSRRPVERRRSAVQVGRSSSA
jgi:integrase